MKDFKDKVIVITGGGTGIGLGFAEAFGAENAKIVISGRRENKLQEAVTKLQDKNIEASYCVGDVTNIDDVEKLANFTVEKYGKVDVLVNNAGRTAQNTSIIEMPIETIKAVFNVNVFGLINCIKVFGKLLLEQGTPSAIYNIGSENSLFNGVPLNAGYIASKHSVRAITEALREELPEYIDVMLICPGFVNSDIGPSDLMKNAMPTNKFVDMAMQQIKDEQFYGVSHAYNIVHITNRFNKLKNAFETYAPRYDGDDIYDVRTIFNKLTNQ